MDLTCKIALQAMIVYLTLDSHCTVQAWYNRDGYCKTSSDNKEFCLSDEGKVSVWIQFRGSDFEVQLWNIGATEKSWVGVGFSKAQTIGNERIPVLYCVGGLITTAGVDISGELKKAHIGGSIPQDNHETMKYEGSKQSSTCRYKLDPKFQVDGQGTTYNLQTENVFVLLVSGILESNYTGSGELVAVGVTAQKMSESVKLSKYLVKRVIPKKSTTTTEKAIIPNPGAEPGNEEDSCSIQKPCMIIIVSLFVGILFSTRTVFL